MKHLIITLDAPLMSFGTTAIDRYGPTGYFPGKALITGLLANALGYQRSERQRLLALQDAISCAARIDREPPGGGVMQDYQTARLGRGADLYAERGEWVVGWTTGDEPATRGGSMQTYEHGGYQRRWRDYLTDTGATVAVAVREGPDIPAIEQAAEALDRPARTLFIGRKPCIPAGRLFAGFAEAPSPLLALMQAPVDPGPYYAPPNLRLQWSPQDQRTAPEEVTQIRAVTIHDLMDWQAGVHAGSRQVAEGRAPRRIFPMAG